MEEANDSAELLRLRKIETRLVAAWKTADNDLEEARTLLVCDALRLKKRQCEVYLGYTPQKEKVENTPTK